MASLNGTDNVTLLNESKAYYTGITLYNNCLYISDSSRRSVVYIASGYLANSNTNYTTLINNINCIEQSNLCIKSHPKIALANVTPVTRYL